MKVLWQIFDAYYYFVLRLHVRKEEFYVDVTVLRNEFLCNKTK